MSSVLQARRLTARFGRGCSECFTRTGPDAGTNACARCGAVVALNDVSLALEDGEILAIMGESGSGKSTLLRVLHLEQAATSGTAELSARVVRDAGDSDRWLADEATVDLLNQPPHVARQLRDRVFGIVYQHPHLGLNFRVSAGGNIAERLLVAGTRNYAKMRARAFELFDQTQIADARIDHDPATYSGGMQQRLQIARALANRPQILLLDEVTSGLDLSVQARILDLILELHQTLRLSILLVTHDIGVARMLASQTLIMKHGCVVERGLTDQILEDPQHPYTQELIGAAL